MKRMAGYLLGCPCLITTFMRQHQPDRIRMSTDSDHARCRNTRKAQVRSTHSTACTASRLYHPHHSQSYCHHQRANTTRSPNDIVYEHEISLATAKGTWESFGDSQVVWEGQPTRRGYEMSFREGGGRSNETSWNESPTENDIIGNILSTTVRTSLISVQVERRLHRLNEERRMSELKVGRTVSNSGHARDQWVNPFNILGLRLR